MFIPLGTAISSLFHLKAQFHIFFFHLMDLHDLLTEIPFALGFLSSPVLLVRSLPRNWTGFSCFSVPSVSVSGINAQEFVQALFEPADNNSVSWGSNSQRLTVCCVKHIFKSISISYQICQENSSFWIWLIIFGFIPVCPFGSGMGIFDLSV